jgi:hypothetical protein
VRATGLLLNNLHIEHFGYHFCNLGASSEKHSQPTEKKGSGAICSWRSTKESLYKGKNFSHYLGKVFSSLGLDIRVSSTRATLASFSGGSTWAGTSAADSRLAR